MKSIVLVGPWDVCRDLYDIIEHSQEVFDITGIWITGENREFERFCECPYYDDSILNEGVALQEVFAGTDYIMTGDELVTNLAILTEKLRLSCEVLGLRETWDIFGFKKIQVNRISILLPTYNRKDQLIETVSGLSEQTDQRFELVIIDNHSDYDVKQTIMNMNLSDEYRSRISIQRYPCNIGLSGTISNLFMWGTCKWRWFISDDDVLYSNDVETIIRDIERFGDEKIGVIQYLHYWLKNRGQEAYARVDSLEDFVSYYQSLISIEATTAEDIQGTMIYLANKVFNMDYIQPFVQYAYQYGSSMIPMDMPILKGLEVKAFSLLQHNVPLMTYVPGRATWNLRKTALGLSTLNYMDLAASREVKTGLLKLFTFDLSTVLFDYQRTGISDPEYLEHLFYNVYQYTLSDNRKNWLNHIILLAHQGSDIETIRDAFRHS